MIKIPLSQGKFALIDDEDYKLVSKYKWSAAKEHNTFYAKTKIRVKGKRTTLRMHRLILGLKKSKVQTDHVDGDGLNNQRHNLRKCNNSQNQCNRGVPKNSTSGFKGVSWNKNAQNWQAKIQKNGIRFHLGSYDTPEEAYRMYCIAAIEYHGEFANVG